MVQALTMMNKSGPAGIRAVRTHRGRATPYVVHCDDHGEVGSGSTEAKAFAVAQDHIKAEH